jgi:hypothetical protein
MPVNSSTQETKTGSLMVSDQPGQKVNAKLFQTITYMVVFANNSTYMGGICGRIIV